MLMGWSADANGRILYCFATKETTREARVVFYEQDPDHTLSSIDSGNRPTATAATAAAAAAAAATLV